MGSHIPAAQAYLGPLPEGEQGFEFTTRTPPDPGAPPGQAYWRGPRDGAVVRAIESIRYPDECPIIEIEVTRTSHDSD